MKVEELKERLSLIILSTSVDACWTVSTRHLLQLVNDAVAAERDKVAQWMIEQSYATGHGDTTEELLKLLDFQAREYAQKLEREACAKVCDGLHIPEEGDYHWIPDGRCALQQAAELIRARKEA